MKNLCNLLSQLFAEGKLQNSDVQNEMDVILGLLCRAEQQLKKPVQRVALIGRSNVGKSTMLNAILGADIAPRRNGPYTAAVVEYHYGSKYSAILHYPNEPLVSIEDCSSSEELLHFLAEHAAVTATSTQTQTQRIIVKAPSELLKQNLVICDTPGLGATDGNSSEEGLHDHIVKDFLAKEDCSQLFWIFKENPQKEEFDFIKQLQENIFIQYCSLINVFDEWSENDKQRVIKQLQNETFIFNNRIKFVNAKEALQNKDIADEIRNFISKINPEEILTAYLYRFVVHCKEIKKCNVKWSRTTFARIKAELSKNFSGTDLAKIINDLEGLSDIND